MSVTIQSEAVGVAFEECKRDQIVRLARTGLSPQIWSDRGDTKRSSLDVVDEIIG